MLAIFTHVDIYGLINFQCCRIFHIWPNIKIYLTIVFLDVSVDSNGWLCKQFCFGILLHLQLREHDENFSRNLFLAAHKKFLISSTSPKKSNYLTNVYIQHLAMCICFTHSISLLKFLGFFLTFLSFEMWNVIPFDFNLHFDFQWCGEASFWASQNGVILSLSSTICFIHSPNNGWIYLPVNYVYSSVNWFFYAVVYLFSYY